MENRSSMNIGLQLTGRMNRYARVVLTSVVLLTSCQSEFYTKRELRSQKVPGELKNRTWTLVEINSPEILDATLTAEFNQTKGTDNCTFTFQFADNGALLMSFKDYKFKGTYLIDGDRFKYLHCGYNMKIVWNTSPECKITPTELAYIFGGDMSFSIEGQTLTIKSSTGNSFKLSTSI